MDNIDKALEYFYDILPKEKDETKRNHILIALSGIERMKKIDPIPSGKYGFECPRCKNDLGIEREDISVYDVPPPYRCGCCGQALNWTPFTTMTS